MRQAVITISPDNKGKEVDIQTGEVSNLEILGYLKTLSQFYAKAIIEEYVDITGDKNIKEENFEQYVEFLRKNKV